MPAKRGATRSQTPSKKAKTEKEAEEVQAPTSPTRKSGREWQPSAQQLESIVSQGSKKTKKTFANVEARKVSKAGGAATPSSPAKAGRKAPKDRSETPKKEDKKEEAEAEAAPAEEKKTKGGRKGAAKKGSAKKGSEKKGSEKKGSAKKGSAKKGSEKEQEEEEEESTTAANKKKGSAKKGSAKKGSEKKEPATKRGRKAASPKKDTAKKLSASPKKGSKKGSSKAAAEEKKSASLQAPSKVEKLHPDILPKLEAYRKSRAFDAKDWIQKKCAMFNKYMADNGLKACMVSLSGGVDSAVTLGLMHYAKNMQGSPIERIVAVAQPIKSSAWALNRAKECAAGWGVEMFTVDQTELHTSLQNLVDKAVGIDGKGFATGQLRSYMRTPVGYYVAQLLSQNGTPCVVMGTGNMDEDGYLAYFCKAGDGVVDIQLIADLHKSEVFAVGKELGVPSSILVAAPSADLWDGHTDEEELGFTYDFVELFTGYFNKLTPAAQKKFVAGLSKGAKEQWGRWSEACIKVHNRNQHKIGGAKNLNVL